MAPSVTTGGVFYISRATAALNRNQNMSHFELLIPVTPFELTIDPTIAASRATKLARRRELNRASHARRRLDHAYVERQRQYDRQYYAAHRPQIAANQARYVRSVKGQATKAAREAAARAAAAQTPIEQLAEKFQNKVQSMPTTTIKSPPSSVSRGRPAWLKELAKQHHVSLAELRQVSKLISAQRQIDRQMAELEKKITGRAAGKEA
jgi:hypothetical protein